MINTLYLPIMGRGLDTIFFLLLSLLYNKHKTLYHFGELIHQKQQQVYSSRKVFVFLEVSFSRFLHVGSISSFVLSVFEKELDLDSNVLLHTK